MNKKRKLKNMKMTKMKHEKKMKNMKKVKKWTERETTEKHEKYEECTGHQRDTSGATGRRRSSSKSRRKTRILNTPATPKANFTPTASHARHVTHTEHGTRFPWDFDNTLPTSDSSPSRFRSKSLWIQELKFIFRHCMLSAEKYCPR